MGRSLIQRVLLALLLGAVIVPVLEPLDCWDATPGIAADTEFHVVALAAAAGLLTVIALIAARVRFLPVTVDRVIACGAATFTRPVLSQLHRAGESPPGPPLRI